MTPLQIIWEAAKNAKPIYYGDKVVHLFSKPSRDTIRAMADSIQRVTQVVLERLEVEFDVSRPEVAFTVFDLGRWSVVSALLREGKSDIMAQLRRHAREAFGMWQLPHRQGLHELANCAALLLREGRPPVAWDRVGQSCRVGTDPPGVFHSSIVFRVASVAETRQHLFMLRRRNWASRACVTLAV